MRDEILRERGATAWCRGANRNDNEPTNVNDNNGVRLLARSAPGSRSRPSFDGRTETPSGAQPPRFLPSAGRSTPPRRAKRGPPRTGHGRGGRRAGLSRAFGRGAPLESGPPARPPTIVAVGGTGGY